MKFAFLLLLISLPTISFRAAANTTVPIIGDLKAHQFTLANGLEVNLIQNPLAPTTSVVHWVKAGSLHERPGITGIAHLFEHMMFRPLKPGEETFSAKLKKLGGTYNANTRFESTVYTSSVPPSEIANLLKTEAERFTRLKVTKELLDMERKAVWSEYATKMDSSPIFDLWYTVYQAGYKNHPYGWMIIGFREDLEKINEKDCNEFFSKFYRPNNVGLVIAGDINLKETEKLVRKYYSQWKRGTEIKKLKAQKFNEGFVSANGKLDAKTNNYLLGFRTPTLDSKNFSTQTIASHILFGSDYSLAKRRLKFSKKLVSDVTDFNFSYDNGMLKVFVTALPGVSENEIINQVLKLSDDFEKLSDSEFSVYVKEAQISLAESLQRNTKLAETAAFFSGKYGNISHLQSFLQSKDVYSYSETSTKKAVNSKALNSKASTKNISKINIRNFLKTYYKKTNLTVASKKASASK